MLSFAGLEFWQLVALPEAKGASPFGAEPIEKINRHFSSKFWAALTALVNNKEEI